MKCPKKIPKHTFISKNDFDSLEDKEKDTGLYHIVEQTGIVVNPDYSTNNMIVEPIVNPISTLKFLGSFNELPNPNLFNNGDIVTVDNKTYININSNWEIIDYTPEPYNNTFKMIPQSFGNCCNCGAPLSGDHQCKYCGTYNGKYTG